MKRTDKFKNQCESCIYTLKANYKYNIDGACYQNFSCGGCINHFDDFPHCFCAREASLNEESCPHYKLQKI